MRANRGTRGSPRGDTRPGLSGRSPTRTPAAPGRSGWSRLNRQPLPNQGLREAGKVNEGERFLRAAGSGGSRRRRRRDPLDGDCAGKPQRSRPLHRMGAGGGPRPWGKPQRGGPADADHRPSLQGPQQPQPAPPSNVGQCQRRATWMRPTAGPTQTATGRGIPGACVAHQGVLQRLQPSEAALPSRGGRQAPGITPRRRVARDAAKQGPFDASVRGVDDL